MTNTLSTFRFALLAAALAFSPVTVALHAQTGESLRVNVPFDFQNGSETMPAGVYKITMLANHALAIIGKKTGGTTLSLVGSSGAKVDAPSKVVFQRYGDKYFLREVWRSGSLDHAVCFKTRAEINAQKAALTQVAATTSPSSAVEIASLDSTR